MSDISRAGTTMIVINGDDFGLTDGVCRGILDLLERGAISNTTMVVAAPGAVPRLRRWNVARLRGRVGVHLQLSGGRPLSPPTEIPTLADQRTGAFVDRAQLGRVDPDDVDREWRRQLATAIELLGGAPTHLDSHHGVHRLPNCVDVYVALAAELGVPARGGDDVVNARMASAQVPGSTTVLRDWTGRLLSLDVLKEALLLLPPEQRAGLVEIVTHPGYCDEDLTTISSLNIGREKDLIALAQLGTEQWLTLNHFRLVSYPDLAPVASRRTRG
nr:ChbG/HpnK family deacetylase [Micromonospora sp. DSM 115978]